MRRDSWEARQKEIYATYIRLNRNAVATARALDCDRMTVAKYVAIVEAALAAQPILDNPEERPQETELGKALRELSELEARVLAIKSQAGALVATPQNQVLEVAGQDDSPPFVSEIARPRVAPAVLDSPAFERWRIAPNRKDTDVYRVLVTPDPQIPYHDTVACRAVELYAADNFFNEWVDLGDFLDLDFLSRHNVGKHRQNAGKILKEHYAAGREVLDRRLAILRRNNPDGAMTMIEGNHDFRVENLLDETPFLEGLVEVEEGLGLKERDVRWVRFWRDGTVHRIGKAGFAHGRYISKYHAAKMVETYCDNIFYGHTHDVMEFPKIMHGRDKVIVGQSMGCLCRYDQSYIKENPKNWQQAFGDFYFLPSGHFTYYVPRIIEGRFVAPNGRIYSGWEGA